MGYISIKDLKNLLPLKKSNLKSLNSVLVLQCFNTTDLLIDVNLP